tara:strand:- start:788 stop:1009 length:222 start_codon:yes stop_codon:yes gene_type:complete
MMMMMMRSWVDDLDLFSQPQEYRPLLSTPLFALSPTFSSSSTLLGVPLSSVLFSMVSKSAFFEAKRKKIENEH